jgi:hypothetical protein
MKRNFRFAVYVLRFKDIVFKFERYGRYNNYIADCRLLIVDWKNKNNQQPATSKQQMKRARARLEREREMRLLVGATLCVVDRKRKIENRKL